MPCGTLSVLRRGTTRRHTCGSNSIRMMIKKWFHTTPIHAPIVNNKGAKASQPWAISNRTANLYATGQPGLDGWYTGRLSLLLAF